MAVYSEISISTLCKVQRLCSLVKLWKKMFQDAEKRSFIHSHHRLSSEEVRRLSSCRIEEIEEEIKTHLQCLGPERINAKFSNLNIDYFLPLHTQ